MSQLKFRLLIFILSGWVCDVTSGSCVRRNKSLLRFFSSEMSLFFFFGVVRVLRFSRDGVDDDEAEGSEDSGDNTWCRFVLD